MYFHYDWICDYLEAPPTLQEAARLLNETGLETEISGAGLEIEHTVNRPDAMCHFGVARELAVKTGTALVAPPVFEGELPVLEGWTIEAEDPDLCPQYLGLKVDGINDMPSPPWLRDRLEAIDQTSHNFVVDLTNFLLWEFGHPSHAFDAERIEAQTITIRFGRSGEKLVTLDGREHDAAGFLCITDRVRPIAFAGVMGGENSEMDSGTTSLLLELARFDGYEVRRTGRGCQIESDARHRFERGVDPENMDRVIRRFLHLLWKHQPQARLIGLHDMNLQPFQRPEVHLRQGRLHQLLGIELDREVVTTWLQRMDCRPVWREAGWDLHIPGYKVDVTREVDVIEEVIRFAGLDLLSSELPPFAGSDYAEDAKRDLASRTRSLLATLGFQEACTFSFLAESWDRTFSPKGEPVRLRNPMSEAQGVMRRMILPNLLDTIRRNVNRGNVGFGLFEIGHVFEGVSEPQHLAVALVGHLQTEHWWDAPQPHPFYRVKGMVEALAAHLRWPCLVFEPSSAAFLDEAIAQTVRVGDRVIGCFGALAPRLRHELDLDVEVVVLEFDLSQLPAVAPRSGAIEEIPSFPGIQIDMAFVVDDEVSYGAMKRHLDDCDMPYLERFDLFDRYRGKAVPRGKKSLGFRFHFRAKDRTLTNDEVAKTMDEVVESVQRKFGAVIRN